MDKGIFISYRRADTQGWAGHLGDALSEAFGSEPLFFDLESLKPGDDFVEAIEEAVGRAAVLLALIGPHWLSALLPDGRRRLDDPNDFVRLEIATALGRHVRVIPVLLGGAVMPQASQLTEDLAGLARRQALDLADTRWEYDFDRLARAIEEISGIKRIVRSPAPDASNDGAVSVGKGLTLNQVEAKDVVGIEAEGPVTHDVLDRPVDVLCDAHVTHSSLGDIVGVRLGQGRKDDKP